MAAVEPMIVKLKLQVDTTELVKGLRDAADALEKLQFKSELKATSPEEIEARFQRISKAQTPTHLILLEAVDGAATTFRLEDPFTRGTHKYLVKRAFVGVARKHPAGSTWYRVPDRPGHFRRDDEEIELLDIVFPDA